MGLASLVLGVQQECQWTHGWFISQLPLPFFWLSVQAVSGTCPTVDTVSHYSLLVVSTKPLLCCSTPHRHRSPPPPPPPPPPRLLPSLPPLPVQRVALSACPVCTLNIITEEFVWLERHMKPVAVVLTVIVGVDDWVGGVDDWVGGV